MHAKSFFSVTLALVGILSGCSEESPTVEAATPDSVTAVTALGRLEPGLGVIEVGASPGDRILSLEVEEGDVVEAGQLLAVLESRDLRRAELELAEAARVEATEALRRARRLGPVAVDTQSSEVTRLEADLELAVSDLSRTEALVGDKVLPTRELDFQRSIAEQARARLEQGRSRLEEEERRQRLEIRGAKAAVDRTAAAIVSAERRLALTEIRSPIHGMVLDLRRLAGEPTGGQPIMTLGEVTEMMAVAEIYETDARHIVVGQKATLTSPALPEPLSGTVETMGRLVRRNDVLSLDPAARTDVRVIEARIRVDEPEKAAAFVHLQVDIRVDVHGGG